MPSICKPLRAQCSPLHDKRCSWCLGAAWVVPKWGGTERSLGGNLLYAFPSSVSEPVPRKHFGQATDTRLGWVLPHLPSGHPALPLVLQLGCWNCPAPPPLLRMQSCRECGVLSFFHPRHHCLMDRLVPQNCLLLTSLVTQNCCSLAL